MQRPFGSSSSPAKPYFTIRMREPPVRQAPTGHDRFQGYTGRLDLRLEVVSEYLHVGGGGIDVTGPQGREHAYYTFVRRDGQLVIPGTSIKGAVRAVLEAISNSCVGVAGRREDAGRDHRRCQNTGALCPACRIFGTTGWRGRAHFPDAAPVGDVQAQVVKIADLWRPRPTKARKFYRSGQFRKLDPRPERNHRFLEAVPKGSVFATSLVFENASAAEMSLLLRAMGLDAARDASPTAAFWVKLGGAKPRCFGAVSFRPLALRLVGPGASLVRDLARGGSPQPVEERLREWLRETSLLHEPSWREFREQSGRPGDGYCPEGLY